MVCGNGDEILDKVCDVVDDAFFWGGEGDIHEDIPVVFEFDGETLDDVHEAAVDEDGGTPDEFWGRGILVCEEVSILDGGDVDACAFEGGFVGETALVLDFFLYDGDSGVDVCNNNNDSLDCVEGFGDVPADWADLIFEEMVVEFVAGVCEWRHTLHELVALDDVCFALCADAVVDSDGAAVLEAIHCGVFFAEYF